MEATNKNTNGNIAQMIVAACPEPDGNFLLEDAAELLLEDGTNLLLEG